MRILLLGANGFIGRYLFAALARRGHHVLAAVRDPRRSPGLETIAIDMNRDTTTEAWLPRLRGVDAVINCAGVLQGTRRDDIHAIHTSAPAALFAACKQAGVRRVVQISAVSADEAAGTEYALSKRAADDRLRASDLDWVVLRPSLVHAPGAYGGTALLRALAALPGAIVLPGRGDQPFQPIHVEDLATVVVKAIETDTLVRKTLDPVGPDVLPLKTILADLRQWLGFAPVRFLEIPRVLIRMAARVGDLFGGTLNSTALRQLEYGNVSDYGAFRSASGIEVRSWTESLRAHPAQWQDRWHARLFFLRPLLRAALVVLWVASGLLGLFHLTPWAMLVAAKTGLSTATAAAALAAACVFDLALGLLLAVRWRPGPLAALQIGAIAAYTLALTLFEPALWRDPLGPLLKNIAIVPAVLALAVLEQDR